MRKLIMLICALSFVVVTYAKPFSMEDYLKSKGETAKPEKVELKAVDYERGIAVNSAKSKDLKKRIGAISKDISKQKSVVSQLAVCLRREEKKGVRIKAMVSAPKGSIGTVNKYVTASNSNIGMARNDYKVSKSVLKKLESKYRSLNRSMVSVEKKISMYKFKISNRDSVKPV